MAFSRHGGFFASLQRVEERLALEEPSPPISDTTASSSSPLVFLDPAAPISATAASDSGPAALDFLTEPPNPMEEEMCGEEEDDDDIARLMALLGLSPPRDNLIHGGDDDDSAGCDCSGADGFLGKVVGVVGPKCQREKTRLDAWIHHFHDAGKRREPARLAHLLLAKKASSSSSSSSHAFAFPPTVKEFLDRDAPPRPCSTEPPLKTD
ncbi:hypothetical protein EJB05_30224 [Eragrostis curvula]|uniref:Uncharacterized protein n=1 Tax=Eragrostis curvula TaxID=38414 RepID=A0A5J9UHE0_9POAL|nr:hypothetical protein EJB05_30224 [Eragrostis curvula]